MAMQSRGILELMDAEKEADKLVKDARKSKHRMSGCLLAVTKEVATTTPE